MQVWESERYDWSQLEAAGTSAKNVPEALEALRLATTEEQAQEAYWRVDNVVVIQGRLFDAALPTAACIVNIISASTSAVSRVRFIELLQQISDGEALAGKEQIIEQINKEVRRGFGIYAGILQYGAELERELCVDLLLSCAAGEPDLWEKVRYYLQRLSTDAAASTRVRDYAAGRLSRCNQSLDL